MLEEGKRCTLTPERIRLLEGQGFRWRLRPKYVRRGAHAPTQPMVGGTSTGTSGMHVAGPDRVGGAGAGHPVRTSIFDEQWNFMFSHLVRYRAEHGHCDVPTRFTLGTGNGDVIRLGKWVHYQRQKYRKVGGGRGGLTPERIHLLEEQGFRWKIRSGEVAGLGGVGVTGRGGVRPGRTSSSHDERWRFMFSHLVQYRAEHGHCDVPRIFKVGAGDEGVVRLGVWVHSQRQKYHGSTTGRLIPEQIRLLEEQGFRWRIDAPGRPRQRRMTGRRSATDVADDGGVIGGAGKERPVAKSSALEERWNFMFSLLVQYRAEHGHCDVPKGFTVGVGSDKFVGLGQWVRTQRRKYSILAKGGKRCTLTTEQIRLLEGQGFKWSVKATRTKPQEPITETTGNNGMEGGKIAGDDGVPIGDGGHPVSTHNGAEMATHTAKVQSSGAVAVARPPSPCGICNNFQNAKDAGRKHRQTTEPSGTSRMKIDRAADSGGHPVVTPLEGTTGEGEDDCEDKDDGEGEGISVSSDIGPSQPIDGCNRDDVANGNAAVGRSPTQRSWVGLLAAALGKLSNAWATSRRT